jgi:hypothetical protein
MDGMPAPAGFGPPGRTCRECHFFAQLNAPGVYLNGALANALCRLAAARASSRPTPISPKTPSCRCFEQTGNVHPLIEPDDQEACPAP